ncbi:adenosylcobinamide-GDP ribazoletransferase [Synergistaceae bacterium OttesenSCG-928-I11]|nr:adenosylcobinamide-GDP ribazoletransferase [Synergistaceae bacterium OttesenSCG-928-I11]
MRSAALDSFARVWMMIARIPLPQILQPQEICMPSARDMAAFPVAGALLALIATIPVWVVAFFLPASPCAWLATAVYLAAGWSFHIDGWGDLWDGLGSGRRGEAMRGVMKDSRVGAFGVAGIVTAIALRSELLASIPVDRWIAASVLAGGVGRLAANVAAYVGTYPWSRGIAGGIVTGMGCQELALAFGVACVLLPLAPEVWVFGVALSALGGYGVAKLAARTLGGVNGDVLGASAVLGELLVLAVAAAR